MRLTCKLLWLAAFLLCINSIGQVSRDTVFENQNYKSRISTFPANQKPSGKYHYIGFQFNQLLRQLLGGAGSADNPYLFSYSFNGVEKGGGMNFGLGFNFSTTEDSDPTINLTRTTKSNSSAIRIGYDVKKSIGKRWIAGYGFDLFRNGGKSETKTTFTGGGINGNTVTTKTNGFGIGPRLQLLYNVSERIYLGTETTVYFVSEKTTSKGDPSVPVSVQQELKEKSFKLGVPVTLFIMLRF